MKKLFKIVTIFVVLTAMFSCATVNTPVAATSNPVGELVGQSSGIVWFNILGTVDAGIKTAAQNGGITEISTVDFEYKTLMLGLGTKYTCTVTGK